MKKTNKQLNLSQEDYINAAKDLFIQLYGQKLYDKLNNTPLKSIDYKGIDIDCPQILAVTVNIKNTFTPEGIEYSDERNHSLLDLFLESVFHMGYQQAIDNNNHTPELMELLRNLRDQGLLNTDELDKIDQ